jgi:predicted alpha/beta superfamily hydrolase
MVTIPGTERRELASEHTGRVYDISIALPPGHAEKDGPCPAVYVLDGQWDFKLVMALHGGLRFDMFVPDAIVVGIAAAGDDPDHDALRARDYTPTADPAVEGSGDAGKFLAFLSEELIPLIEQHYRADPTNRTLVGSSLGGLFALHTMFTEPDLFGSLVVVSPAIVWDEEAVTADEEQLARRRSHLPVRLFLAAGALELAHTFLDPLDRLVDRIHGRGYRDLQLAHVVIAGERHAGVKAEAFNRGLRWVFNQPPADLPVDDLGSYAGEYLPDDHDLAPLKVRVEGDRLIVEAEPGWHDGDELVPVVPDGFRFTSRIAGEARFHRDVEGNVDRVSIRLAERTITLKKAS